MNRSKALADTDGAAASRAVTKAGWRILPLVGCGYLVAFMDRVNVGFAATQMNVDLGFSATVYGMGAGIFFLAYSLFEVPSNLLLLRFGARRWLARIMITWGILAAAITLVHTPLQFYVLRFLVGAAEAGFFPGVVYLLSCWFPAASRGRAVSLFYLANPLSLAVMGVLSSWLLTLDGIAGLRGWQWIFLVEGLPSALIGILILIMLPDTPDKAGWLSDAERRSLLAALDHGTSGDQPTVSQEKVVDVLRNPTVQLLALMDFLSIGTTMTFLLSAPVILIELTGQTTQQVGVLVSIGGLVGAVSMLAAGWVSDWRRERFALLVAGLAIAAAGHLLIGLAPTAYIVVTGFLLLSCGRGLYAVSHVALWTDLLRARELAIGAAAINTVAQMGSFLGPIMLGAARDASGSYHSGMLAMPMLVMLALLAGLALWRRVRIVPQPA